MPSPFPGVDPYLESQGYWPDFHSRFVNDWCDALVAQLPDNYEVRIDERVNLVEHGAGRARQFGPDLTVEQRQSSRRTDTSSSAVATLEPVTIPLVIEDETRETFIRILHRPERTLVAVLELLSPSNKEELGRGDYLAKRNAILRQNVHLVELDLLLGGRRLPLQEELPSGDYYALISRGDRRPDCHVYAWTVRQPLPTLPVPLKAPDPDLSLDLQAVFDVTYERGRYARSVNYRDALTVPLSPETLTWVVQQAKSMPSG